MCKGTDTVQIRLLRGPDVTTKQQNTRQEDLRGKGWVTGRAGMRLLTSYLLIHQPGLVQVLRV